MQEAYTMSFENLEQTSEVEPDQSFAGNMQISNPSSQTFSGAQLNNPFESMFGQQLGKQAAANFYRMKTAQQAQVLTSNIVPAMTKLALIKNHVKLSSAAKLSLGKFVLSKMSSAQKRALFGNTIGNVTGGKALTKKDNIPKALNKATNGEAFKRQGSDTGRSYKSKKLGK